MLSIGNSENDTAARRLAGIDALALLFADAAVDGDAADGGLGLVLDLLLGLGMDWTPNKWLSINIAPLTGGFTIVRAEQLRKTYGMLLREDGLDPAVGSNYRSAKFQFGAQVKADAKFVINEVFTYGTQVVIFTDYLDNPFKEYRVNWDNKITWNVGKYFKIGLDTWFIYDPNVIIKNDKDIAQYPEGRARGQFKEFTSFNFAYTLKPRRLRDAK